MVDGFKRPSVRRGKQPVVADVVGSSGGAAPTGQDTDLAAVDAVLGVGEPQRVNSPRLTAESSHIR